MVNFKSTGKRMHRGEDREEDREEECYRKSVATGAVQLP